jgi:uncharacterized RDD family membrane protein YckC
MQNFYQDNYTEIPAVRGKRLINLMVDMIACLGIWMLLSLAALFVGKVFNYNPSYDGKADEEAPLLPLMMVMPVFWGYYILSEYFFQRTLGKLITKTKVVNGADVKPSFNQVVIRTVIRSIPFDYLSFLATSNGVHDRLSKTRVVGL